MAFEKRRKREYYYRKQRIGSRVMSIYIGRGEQAELVAAQDRLARAQRKLEHEAEQRLRGEAEALDQSVIALQAQAADTLHAALEADGFHQHKGQWRQKRGHGSQN